MAEQQVKDALAKIDAATNSIATNLTVASATIQTIGDETTGLKDALKAALANGQGVSQELVDQADALSVKANSTSDALNLLIPVLQSIAANGVIDPVPLSVPVVTD